MSLKNAFSVDVEDYFQVSAFEHIVERSRWDSMEHRVRENIDKTLAMLSEHDTKATFFTLGWLAERYPTMIRQIVDEGHELASHGYKHQRVFDLTPDSFRRDLQKTKQILEDITGVEILGYRAPSYSIDCRNIWAFEILAETGHVYSSSIFPGKHDHYGFPGAPRFAFKDEHSGIIEVPISTATILSATIPAGGGGFFRLYPYPVSRWLIHTINDKDGQSAVFYTHPWEIDPNQPIQSNLSFKTRFRHYLNLDKTEARIRKLLSDFSWGRMDEIFIRNKTLPVIKLS